jgi:hypothetical protein
MSSTYQPSKYVYAGKVDAWKGNNLAFVNDLNPEYAAACDPNMNETHDPAGRVEPVFPTHKNRCNQEHRMDKYDVESYTQRPIVVQTALKAPHGDTWLGSDIHGRVQEFHVNEEAHYQPDPEHFQDYLNAYAQSNYHADASYFHTS